MNKAYQKTVWQRFIHKTQKWDINKQNVFIVLLLEGIWNNNTFYFRIPNSLDDTSITMSNKNT